MKLSIDFGQPLEKLGLKNAAKAVKEAGFDAVDFSFKDGTGKAFLLSESWEQEAKRIRQVLSEHGLSCNQAHAPTDFSSADKICPRADKFALLIRSLSFSAILGAKAVVVHAVTDVPPVDFIPYNLRFYKTLEPYAAKAGVKIAVENLFKFDKKYHRFEGVFETSEKLSSFLQKLRSPVFTACVDVGHAKLTGTAPEKYLAGMNASLLGCLHLHDNDGKDDLHLLPYMGELNWNGILATLKKLGYKGDLSFEVMFFLERFSAEELPYALALAGEFGNKFRDRLTGENV